MMYHKQCNTDSASDKSKLFLCPVWIDPSFQLHCSFILSNSLCSHVFCDILITEIVLEGGSKAVFVFVCTSVYMFIGGVCVNGGRGRGVGG